MDHEAFDRIARMLGAAGSRRAALAAVLGSGSLGAVGSALGTKKSRNKNRGKGHGKGKERGKNRDKGRQKSRGKKRQGVPAAGNPAPAGDAVGAEAADCFSLESGSNLNECNFAGDDLDGIDLSGSSMRKTNFNGASLCGAKLHDSQLREADLRNANLTKADLHSSGCVGLKTNAATRLCNTVMCNGSVNNSDCPSGVDACCETDDCPQRACFTVECDATSACDYEIQANGAPGNLCPAPRECCNGNCCPEGQKCCGTSCIPADQCCTNGQAGCPAGQQCCGGETCNACCNGNAPGCPQGQACCGNTCQAGVCCANNTVCSSHLQCCGADEDEAACIQFPSGANRCCTTGGNHEFGNEDSCGLCCPGLTCCEHRISGRIRCEEDILDCELP